LGHWEAREYVAVYGASLLLPPSLPAIQTLDDVLLVSKSVLKTSILSQTE